jgi:hypothetical protein
VTYSTGETGNVENVGTRAREITRQFLKSEILGTSYAPTFRGGIMANISFRPLPLRVFT